MEIELVQRSMQNPTTGPAQWIRAGTPEPKAGLSSLHSAKVGARICPPPTTIARQGWWRGRNYMIWMHLWGRALRLVARGLLVLSASPRCTWLAFSSCLSVGWGWHDHRFSGKQRGISTVNTFVTASAWRPESPVQPRSHLRSVFQPLRMLTCCVMCISARADRWRASIGDHCLMVC